MIFIHRAISQIAKIFFAQAKILPDFIGGFGVAVTVRKAGVLMITLPLCLKNANLWWV